MIENNDSIILETDPKKSLHDCIAFSSIDFSKNRHSAWIYGIICGWDDESLTEIKKDFHWSDKEIERLKKLHEDFLKLS